MPVQNWRSRFNRFPPVAYQINLQSERLRNLFRRRTSRYEKSDGLFIVAERLAAGREDYKAVDAYLKLAKTAGRRRGASTLSLEHTQSKRARRTQAAHALAAGTTMPSVECQRLVLDGRNRSELETLVRPR